MKAAIAPFNRSSQLPARKKPERREPERGGPERDYGPSR